MGGDEYFVTLRRNIAGKGSRMMGQKTFDAESIKCIRKISRICDAMLLSLTSSRTSNPIEIRQIIEVCGNQFLQVARELSCSPMEESSHAVEPSSAKLRVIDGGRNIG